MSLLNAILGNASEIKREDLLREFAEILVEGESIEAAYKLIRDKWVFTNKRLIVVNVQGVTGTKREYHSIPYRSINQFAVETSGTFDEDCELKLWIKGAKEPLIREFKRGTDIKGLQRTLATHLLVGE
ncbi:MAG: PH domain-containing protein [Rikenellaceae bacterium]|nr:PH domain-containing protein [Rikenellaceae bacterium]